LLEKLLLVVDFPKLTTDSFDLTSPKDGDYNCIAWAAGENDRKWWPDKGGDGYWPPGIPRAETMDAFIAAYATLGYECCESDELEAEFEKIAIFAKPSGKPAHAARQLPDGGWTSKLGDEQDIRHAELRGVENHIYGVSVQCMRRKRD
jgi:hypothetical protein